MLTYGRFLFANKRTSANPELIEQLKQLSADGNAEAMVVLGNLHARGYTVKPSVRQAVRWYKKAVKADPQNASIVNEVAWTLTVTDIKTLQRARYARRVMNQMMQTNLDAAARPEYLDTWAATHAASGDFAGAIRLQEQAIAAASVQNRDDVLGVLNEHLELFKAGAAITEQAP